MKYIVSAPPYDETNGGAIFQHLLVHTLNGLGETACLWPQPPIYRKSKRERLLALFQTYATSPDFDTPVFRGKSAPADAIVVYPEVVLGNPLKAAHVVRWLLYRPGVRHPYEFTENEMFFHCGEFFDVPEITGGAPELSMWYRNRTYRNENRPDRKGVCYIVRKGDKKPRLPETETPDAVQIDDMTHAQVNEVFNRSETFISYDEATTYSQFAAICGCDSIIVPGFYDSHEEWAATHPLGRYGVSYGFDHLDHARATRHKVIGMMDAQEKDSVESVRNFVRLTKERFGKAAQPA
ncbi:MAG: hypothetical protein HKN98_13435 [Silicimonas sp.]|nr:hypothetical protein [Silicimonas sp.]NND22278.1 hypothetical protein [Silicimonas sp.]NNF91679.1 hypothetical protein [Boseongicola sp.]